MAIRMEWPENLLLPDVLVEKWFTEAVAKNQIDPLRLSAKTPQAMAEALDNAGLIRLARDTTKTEDER